jgi:hypothetical protein
MTGLHELKFDDQPMLFKVFVQQTADVIVHLRSTNGTNLKDLFGYICKD